MKKFFGYLAFFYAFYKVYVLFTTDYFWSSLVSVILFSILGFSLIFSSTNSENEESLTTKDTPQKEKLSLEIYVAAVTKNPYKKNIKNYVEVYENNYFNKNITSQEKSTFGKSDFLELIPEPTNQFDKDAIRVVSKIGDFGYIPAVACRECHELLAKCPNPIIDWIIRGGKVKNEYTGKIETSPYYIDLIIRER